jgi:hypothetical protein
MPPKKAPAKKAPPPKKKVPAKKKAPPEEVPSESEEEVSYESEDLSEEDEVSFESGEDESQDDLSPDGDFVSEDDDSDESEKPVVSPKRGSFSAKKSGKLRPILSCSINKGILWKSVTDLFNAERITLLIGYHGIKISQANKGSVQETLEDVLIEANMESKNFKDFKFTRDQLAVSLDTSEHAGITKTIKKKTSLKIEIWPQEQEGIYTFTLTISSTSPQEEEVKETSSCACREEVGPESWNYPGPEMYRPEITLGSLDFSKIKSFPPSSVTKITITTQASSGYINFGAMTSGQLIPMQKEFRVLDKGFPLVYVDEHNDCICEVCGLTVESDRKDAKGRKGTFKCETCGSIISSPAPTTKPKPTGSRSSKDRRGRREEKPTPARPRGSSSKGGCLCLCEMCRLPRSECECRCPKCEVRDTVGMCGCGVNAYQIIKKEYPAAIFQKIAKLGSNQLTLNFREPKFDGDPLKISFDAIYNSQILGHVDIYVKDIDTIDAEADKLRLSESKKEKGRKKKSSGTPAKRLSTRS